MRPSSTGARDSKSTNVGHDCIGNSVAGGAYIRVFCGTNIYIGSACIDNISAVKYSGMHSQSFWNLKVKSARLEIQLETGCAYIENICVGWNLEVGGTELKIRIETGFACIKSACFCQNIEVKDTRLEIRVGVSCVCIKSACFR